MRELRNLKNLGVEIQISIGGWTQSKYFSKMVANDTDMQNFVDTFINYFIKGNVPKRYGGDGFARGVFTSVSVDWEFPGWSGPE